MKKIVLLAMAAVFAAIIVRAQEIPERKRVEMKPIIKEKVIAKKQMASLDLTDEQKAQLKSMNQDLRRQMDDLRKQDDISVKEYREKMETLHKDRESRFESMLTDKQKAQRQKDKEASRARGKELGKKKQQRMKEELNLTDDQVAKMSENRKNMAEKIKTIQDNKSLSDEQKKQETKQVMKKQKKDMKSILTDEQLQKMKEEHKQNPKKRQVI